MGTPLVDGAGESFVKKIGGIGQARVVSCNDVAEECSEWRKRVGEDGASGGVVLAPGWAAAGFLRVDVCF